MFCTNIIQITKFYKHYMREREREEKIKRKTPKPKCGRQCTWGKNLLFYNNFTTHHSSEKEKVISSLYIKKKTIRERESEKPITIGEDNTVCINQWAPSPVFRWCCHCSWCRLNENKFDLKTKWSVKKLLFVVFPELFFFFFGTILIAVIGGQINIIYNLSFPHVFHGKQWRGWESGTRTTLLYMYKRES